MCPNHIDTDLEHIDPSINRSATSPRPVDALTGHPCRVRRPKQLHIIEIGLRRGFRNNGHIEIENDSSAEESDIEREAANVVYLLPEKGVKLDFIDRVKR